MSQGSGRKVTGPPPPGRVMDLSLQCAGLRFQYICPVVDSTATRVNIVIMDEHSITDLRIILPASTVLKLLTTVALQHALDSPAYSVSPYSRTTQKCSELNSAKRANPRPSARIQKLMRHFVKHSDDTG